MGNTRLAALAAAVALGGCATFSKDGGMDEVNRLTQERTGQPVRWQRTDEDREAASKLVREKLRQPLMADDAVQIALVNNPGLQSTYAELGIAEADVVAAGRLPNPRISSLRTKRGEDVSKVEQSISLEVLSLLTLPMRYRLEQSRFERVRAEVARETLGVAAETRRAWIEAVAAEETVRYARTVQESAEAGAELARRMARAGNFSRLQHMREQAFYADATAQLARAQHQAVGARERLSRLMGLTGEEGAFSLPERLPDLPEGAALPQDVEASALRNRLDIQAAQKESASLASSLGLVRATRFVNAVELGRARTKEGDDPFAYGWSFSLEIPLFDFGTARVAQAEALYMQSASRLAETVVNARSQVREAYAAYRTSHALARHYRDEIVPLRKRISEENVLRYNGMLISVFELLADAREQVLAVSAAIDATRDYWLAEADLQSALTGAGPMTRGAPRASAMAAPRAGGGH
jgi:outer membrane protein TolC